MELVSKKMTPEDQQDAPKTHVTKVGKKAPGAFLTISEVAEELDLQQHVLRFWETKFSQVKPLKRGGGRRYYRPEDVTLLKVIHSLLYTDKYTIKGVQKLLKGQSKMQIIQSFVSNNNDRPSQIASNDQTVEAKKTSPEMTPSTDGLNGMHKQLLKETIEDLKELRSMISNS